MSITTELNSLRKRSWIEILQYIAVSLLILGLILGLFYAGMSWDFFSKWAMFAIFTGALTWIFLEHCLSKAGTSNVRILICSVLIVHCSIWFLVLRHTASWNVIWYRIVMPIEFGAFLVCARWVTHRRRKSKAKGQEI